MTADWTTCRVVRDRDDLLWTNAYDETLADSGGWWASVIGSHTGEALESWRGPLTPVLDADGQPMVTTVGDLTARHVGKRVRLDEHYDAKLETIFAHESGDVSLNFTHSEGFAFGCSRTLDTPCEVLA